VLERFVVHGCSLVGVRTQDDRVPIQERQRDRVSAWRRDAVR